MVFREKSRVRAGLICSRFPNTDMIADPLTKHFCDNGDTFNGWIGQDVHFLFSTIKNGSDCCWVLTHRVRPPQSLLGLS